VASGLGGVGKAAANAAMSPLRRAGEAMKGAASGAAESAAQGDAGSGGEPRWAAAMKRRQTMTHAAAVAAHTLRSGDGGGGGSSIDVSEKD
jgi:type IV secretion system protein TrbL